MVATQVMGNHLTVTIAGSQGNFELNVFKPVIIRNVLESIQLLADASQSFTDNCLVGIQVNDAQLKRNIDHSLMLVTALNPVIGYDKAAQVAKKAMADNISLEDAAVQLGFLQPGEFSKYVQPQAMLEPTAVS